MRLKSLLLRGSVLIVFLLPLSALADGSQSYTAGTYTFTVPAYGTLTVTLYAGGGGGGGGWMRQGNTGGGNGGDSTFNGSVDAQGGGGGIAGSPAYYGVLPPPGSTGGGSGGTVTAGGGGAGGTGGTYQNIYTGGTGGNGGEVTYTYNAGALTPGSSVSIVVGAGGTAGTGSGTAIKGGDGTAVISWTSPLPTSCTVTLSPSTVTQGGSATLSWSSANATSVYINNVGYVGASGSTVVSPSVTTDYSCTATGSGSGGSDTATSNFTFTVPAYNSLTVSLYAGGGGGGGGWMRQGDSNGTAGGDSTFNGSIDAQGGGGGTAGSPGYSGYTQGGPPAPAGATGGGSGGTVTTGGGGAGGTGGTYQGFYTGGAGGAGGSVTYTYSTGALTTGASIPVVVGAAGAAGTGSGTATSGGAGSAVISWTGGSATASYAAKLTVSAPPTPTCNVLANPNPSAYAASGAPVTMSWVSANADQVYINNIGCVAASGSTNVASQSSTDYSCVGYSSAAGYGSWFSYSLSVVAQPGVTISANPTSVVVGQPSTITATFTPSSGDAVSNDTINIGSTSEIPYSTATTRTYTFTPGSAGTTTLLPYIQTTYFPSWNTYGQSVNVTAYNASAPSETLTANGQSPYTWPQGAPNYTLAWSSSNATSCFLALSNGTNYTSWPTSGSGASGFVGTYALGCTGAGGTSTTTLAVTQSCAVSYSCSGQTIVRTNADCSTTNTQSCVSPQYCQSGSSSCVAPAIVFNPSGNFTGQLQIVPGIVSPGETTKVYWNVSNAQSCTVTGTNGDSWTGASGAKTTKPITNATTYTLSCLGYSPNPNVTETAGVSVTPKFFEN